MAEDELEELLARTGLGDRAAFARLYDLTAAKLLGVALRILGNRADAEEAVQEVYVKLWHVAGRFQAGRGAVMGWLVTLARNQAIDQLRARRAPARDIETLPDLADARPGPEASAEAADTRRQIEGCLAELPADRASAVHAAYVEGYSYEELARRHDVPLNTMRTWLRRALISLRECLGR
jgi:RNA polymerase sigma-70 factor (ECF subfamily)